MLFFLFFAACSQSPFMTSCSPPVVNEYITNNYVTYTSSDTGENDSDDASDFYIGAPTPNTDVSDMGVDIFGDGNVLYLAVDPEVVIQANKNWQNENGNLYEIEGGVTLTEDLIVVDGDTCNPQGNAFDDCKIASYGPVEFQIAGQSTGVAWESTTIPNIALDMDEAQDDLTLGGVEYMRFNNGQVGSIFREAVTLEIFRELGYPAPRTSFNWLMSNQWPEGTMVPYTTVQPYKQDWCKENAKKLGGGCTNMWEGWGDVTSEMVTYISNECQLSDCTNTVLNEAAATISNSLYSSNFQELTSSFLDWSSIQTHQCIDWVLWIGDDYYHNYNNVVVVERADGKLMFLPYSTDISLGQDWYQNTELYGWSAIPTGCQWDNACWAETIATCQATIDAFQALNPTQILDNVYERLETKGMLRSGDEERYSSLWAWINNRATEGVLEEELETYRMSWRDMNCDESGGDTAGSSDTGGEAPAPPPGGGGYETGSYVDPCAM